MSLLGGGGEGDIELLSLDAGNTVIFLDHARLARLATEMGHPVTGAELIVSEGKAKQRAERGDLIDFEWSEAERVSAGGARGTACPPHQKSAPGAAGWGRMVASILFDAGVPLRALAPMIESAWVSHVDHNLWSLVPDGFKDAMLALRASGVRTAIVSNSEGMLDVLFEKLGILDCFDTIVDSGKVGVTKPDPAIFAIACERTHARASHAIHLGDMHATDIAGARAAGMRCALIDPYKHYEGLYPDVPRVVSAVEVARELTRAASSKSP